MKAKNDNARVVYQDGEVVAQNRFEKNPRVKANFNSDLQGVAVDKVKRFELSASIGSQDSMKSNSERVEHLLRSVDKTKRNTT